MEMVLEDGRVPSMKYTGAEAIRAWDRRRNCGWARKSLAPRRSGGRQCRESLWGINALFFTHLRCNTKATPPGPRIGWGKNGSGMVVTGQVSEVEVVGGE